MISIKTVNNDDCKNVKNALIQNPWLLFEGFTENQKTDNEIKEKLEKDFELYKECAEEDNEYVIPCSYQDYDNYSCSGNYSVQDKIVYAAYYRTDLNAVFAKLESLAGCSVCVQMNNWGKHRYYNTCYKKEFYTEGKISSMFELKDSENEEERYFLCEDAKSSELQGMEIADSVYPFGVEITENKSGKFVCVPYFYKAENGDDCDGYEINSLSKISYSPTLDELKKLDFDINESSTLKDFTIKNNIILCPKSERIFEGNKYAVCIVLGNSSQFNSVLPWTLFASGYSNQQKNEYLKYFSLNKKDITFENGKISILTNPENNRIYIKYLSNDKVDIESFSSSDLFNEILKQANEKGEFNLSQYTHVKIFAIEKDSYKKSDKVVELVSSKESSRVIPDSYTDYFLGEEDINEFDGSDMYGNEIYYEMDADEIFTVEINGHENISHDDIPVCYNKSEECSDTITMDVDITEDAISSYYDDPESILEDSYQNIERYSLYSQGSYVYYLVDENGNHVSSLDKAVGYENRGWNCSEGCYVDEPCPFILIKLKDWDCDNECVKEEARSKYNLEPEPAAESEEQTPASPSSKTTPAGNGTSSKIKCPNCGTENEAGNAFCSTCGTKIGSSSASKTGSTLASSAMSIEERLNKMQADMNAKLDSFLGKN